MQERLLSKNKSGSITVYLTLMLLVMLSFIFTSIEASRITASKAYLAMLSRMASESLKGTYYYPLFNEYGLLAVDSGYGDTEQNLPYMADWINEKIETPIEQTDGGLLKFVDLYTSVLKTEGLQDSEGSGFVKQIRENVLYDSAELLISAFVDNPDLENSKPVAVLHDKQEAAMNSAKKVSETILKLMTQVDGIGTTRKGLDVKRGDLYSVGSFVKIFGAVSPEYMASTYGNLRVFGAVDEHIIYPRIIGQQLLKDFEKMTTLKKQIADLERIIREQTDEISALSTEEPRDNERIDFLLSQYLENVDEVEGLRSVYKETEGRAIEGYGVIKEVIEISKGEINVALPLVSQLKEKQEAAVPSVMEYEKSVREIKSMGTELREYYQRDIEGLRGLMGMEPEGYDTFKMIQTLKYDRDVLSGAMMPHYDAENLPLMISRTEIAIDAAEKIHYDGLRFNYGRINLEKHTGFDLEEYLNSLIGGGILAMIGVTDISDKGISGEDLPSGTLSGIGGGSIKSAMESGMSFFKNADFKAIVDSAIKTCSDSFVTEVYLQNNFSHYKNQRENTKICYEREYVLCGHKTDEANLSAMALRFFGLRMVMSLAAVLSDSTRTMLAESLAVAIAGMTGIAPLLYAIKYLVLIIWAVEEALVEVCALFMGKAVPIFCKSGHVTFAQLFLMNTVLIRTIAESFSGFGGPKYTSYMTFLSLFENVNKRNNRSMDLIQENMRFRFRDSFRIRNCVTRADFFVMATLKQKFDTGIFKESAYEHHYKTSMSY